MSDWNNTYQGAGPGTKRRIAEELKALSRQEKPHSPERKKRKTKPTRERLDTEWRDVSVSEIKARVMALTLSGNDPRQILAALEGDGIRVTLVTIGNLHRHFKDAIKLLQGLGLIHQARLDRYLARD